jgi:probable F420-dependent oxidoreductase
MTTMSTSRRTATRDPWRLGIGLPNALAGTGAASIAAAAAAAADHGWAEAWVSDHVLVDRSIAGQYGLVFEAITTLAWVAGMHPGLGVGLGVLVAPMREPILVAKQLATLDALSGGRLTVGVGVGWSRAEYGNLGKGDRFGRRGRDLDEAIALWRHLWSGTAESFEGPSWSLEDFAFGPLPVRGQDLPLMIGGKSDAALRRTIEFGAGYIASQSTPEELRGRIEQLAGVAQQAGRPMPSVAVRVPFTAEEAVVPGLVHTRMAAYLKAGAGHLIVGTPVTDPAAVSDWVTSVTSAAEALAWRPRTTAGS